MTMVVGLVQASPANRENNMSDELLETKQELWETKGTLEKTIKQRDTWHNAWFEAHALSGKMWWDGATYGYTQGLADKGEDTSPYGIAKRANDVARDVSVLIEIRRTAYLDVGREVPIHDPLEANMLPLTFVVTKYNTGDQILFQYVAGKPRVVRIKTHDGLFMDTNGELVKSPQAELFKK